MSEREYCIHDVTMGTCIKCWDNLCQAHELTRKDLIKSESEHAQYMVQVVNERHTFFDRIEKLTEERERLKAELETHARIADQCAAEKLQLQDDLESCQNHAKGLQYSFDKKKEKHDELLAGLMSIGNLPVTNDAGRFGSIIDAVKVGKILERVGIV